MNVNYSPKQKGSLRDSEKNVRATLPGGFRASFGGAFLLLVAILRQSPVKTNDSKVLFYTTNDIQFSLT